MNGMGWAVLVLVVGVLALVGFACLEWSAYQECLRVHPGWYCATR